MWKKLISSLMAVAVVMTATVSVAFGASPYVESVEVKPGLFDPSQGETVEVQYTLGKDLNTGVFVQDPVANSTIKVLDPKNAAGAPNEAAGDHTVNWDGTNTAGAVVEDGTYEVRVVAYDEAGLVIDVESANAIVMDFSAPVPPSTNVPDITNLDVVPDTFAANRGEIADISFDIDKTANVTLRILDSSDNVVMFYNEYLDRYLIAGSYYASWDGESYDGDMVADGVYTVQVIARNDQGFDVEETSVEVDSSTGGDSAGVITNVMLDPSRTWDPTDDDELEIEFELERDVSFFTIDAVEVNGNEVIEIVDDTDVEDGDYTEEWDGTDDDGDYIDAGPWDIIIQADQYKVVKRIDVEYEKPEIIEAFVTKDEFDNDQGEETTLAYKVDAEALVTIEIYNGNTKEFTLIDEKEVVKNRYYTVSWDGYDEDGYEVSEGSNWKFRITAENRTDNDIVSTKEVEIDVLEDDVSSNKSNVTNDFPSPVVLDYDTDGQMTIHYCMDEDAEVFIAVYEGTSSTGSSEIELLDYEDQDEGCHSVSWNGNDEDDKELDEGIYTYKIVSRVGSRKDTETGHFVVGDRFEGGGVTPPNPPEEEGCDIYSDLYYLDDNSELCRAVAWATDEGIIDGYPDGTFGPNVLTNRAEVLKMIFEAFDVTVLPATGDTFGFNDVAPGAWYMPYVRTASVYGMLHGYNNGTEARLGANINRVELLKFALEASEAFTSFEVPEYTYSYYVDAPVSEWYGDYAGVAFEYMLLDDAYYGNGYHLSPGALVERSEVVTMLYRMDGYGLLDNFYAVPLQ